MLPTEKKIYHFLEPGMPLCALCTHLDNLFVESWAESESDSAILSGSGAVWLRNKSGVSPIQKKCFVTFTGEQYTNEAVQKPRCVQIGFPEQYLMIGLEDGRWPLANRRGATLPKLKGWMDAGTKIANPEIIDEGFQPIGKGDGPSWSNWVLCSSETQELAIEYLPVGAASAWLCCCLFTDMSQQWSTNH